jgi:phage baseplate assembly protein W
VAVYDFTSVGKKQLAFEAENAGTAVTNPIGIKTPIELTTNSAGTFAMNTDLALQIRDNFRNMLNTNAGERLMLPDFGANLRPLAFELATDTAAEEAVRRISSTTNKYMPYIELSTFEPFIKQDNNVVLASGVRIIYSIPSIGVTNQAVEAIIYTAG